MTANGSEFTQSGWELHSIVPLQGLPRIGGGAWGGGDTVDFLESDKGVKKNRNTENPALCEVVCCRGSFLVSSTSYHTSVRVASKVQERERALYH